MQFLTPKEKKLCYCNNKEHTEPEVSRSLRKRQPFLGPAPTNFPTEGKKPTKKTHTTKTPHKTNKSMPPQGAKAAAPDATSHHLDQNSDPNLTGTLQLSQ